MPGTHSMTSMRSSQAAAKAAPAPLETPRVKPGARARPQRPDGPQAQPLGAKVPGLVLAATLALGAPLVGPESWVPAARADADRQAILEQRRELLARTREKALASGGKVADEAAPPVSTEEESKGFLSRFSEPRAEESRPAPPPKAEADGKGAADSGGSSPFGFKLQDLGLPSPSESKPSEPPPLPKPDPSKAAEPLSRAAEGAKQSSSSSSFKLPEVKLPEGGGGNPFSGFKLPDVKLPEGAGGGSSPFGNFKLPDIKVPGGEGGASNPFAGLKLPDLKDLKVPDVKDLKLPDRETLSSFKLDVEQPKPATGSFSPFKLPERRPPGTPAPAPKAEEEEEAPSAKAAPAPAPAATKKEVAPPPAAAVKKEEPAPAPAAKKEEAAPAAIKKEEAPPATTPPPPPPAVSKPAEPPPPPPPKPLESASKGAEKAADKATSAPEQAKDALQGSWFDSLSKPAEPKKAPEPAAPAPAAKKPEPKPEPAKAAPVKVQQQQQQEPAKKAASGKRKGPLPLWAAELLVNAVLGALLYGAVVYNGEATTAAGTVGRIVAGAYEKVEAFFKPKPKGGSGAPSS